MMVRSGALPSSVVSVVTLLPLGVSRGQCAGVSGERLPPDLSTATHGIRNSKSPKPHCLWHDAAERKGLCPRFEGGLRLEVSGGGTIQGGGSSLEPKRPWRCRGVSPDSWRPTDAEAPK